MKNVVVVGYGGMGAWHVDYIKKSDVVALSGIYDICAERTTIAIRDGINAYNSLDEAINDPKVDIVLVATPNDVHKDIAIQALNAGKNVITEKPVTLTSDDLADMITASEQSGKLFTVHQNRRWDNDFLSIKDIFNSGTLGDVFNIESRVHGSRGIPGDWRGRKAEGGGMMLDWGVHIIDQVLMMVPGKIKKINARFDNITNCEVDDGFKLELIFENGIRAFLEVGTSNFISLPRWYMQGENGTAIINDFSCEGKIVCVENWDEKDVIPVKTAAGLTKTMAPRKDDTIVTHELPAFDADVHDFYRNVVKAIDGKEQPLVTHEQLMRVMKVMEAAFESNEVGQVLSVDL